ncbi:hypothetical protein BN1708_018532, partial [Verticillium longisporum]
RYLHSSAARAALGEPPGAAPDRTSHRCPLQGRGPMESADLVYHLQATTRAFDAPGRCAVHTLGTHLPVLVSSFDDLGVRARSFAESRLPPWQAHRRGAVGTQQRCLDQPIPRASHIPSFAHAHRLGGGRLLLLCPIRRNVRGHRQLHLLLVPISHHTHGANPCRSTQGHDQRRSRGGGREK